MNQFYKRLDHAVAIAAPADDDNSQNWANRR